MKKLIVVLVALASFSASAANWKCSIQNVCSPILSPFLVNVDKSFIEFPELGGDHAIENSGQNADTLFFEFDVGSVEIVLDDGIVNNSPMGGQLSFEGDTFDILCKMDL